MYRDNTKTVKIGNCVIGGGNKIAIQSMTNTRTENVKETVKQILALEEAGCDIVRCTVPTQEAADAIREIKRYIHIPLVADIHLITEWQSRRLKTVPIKSESIPEI